jgi:hypothetical protein
MDIPENANRFLIFLVPTFPHFTVRGEKNTFSLSHKYPQYFLFDFLPALSTLSEFG